MDTAVCGLYAFFFCLLNYPPIVSVFFAAYFPCWFATVEILHMLIVICDIFDTFSLCDTRAYMTNVSSVDLAFSPISLHWITSYGHESKRHTTSKRKLSLKMSVIVWHNPMKREIVDRFSLLLYIAIAATAAVVFAAYKERYPPMCSMSVEWANSSFYVKWSRNMCEFYELQVRWKPTNMRR